MKPPSSAAACWDDGAHIDGLPALAWVQQALAALRHNSRVTLLARTTAFGYFPHNLHRPE
jgi:sarcosine oxidase subunit alpha